MNGTTPTYIDFRLGNFYDSGFKHCKIRFTSWYANGGYINITLGGVTRNYNSSRPNNPGTLEDDLQSEDAIVGSVSQQNICYFTAEIIMS